MSTYDAAVQHQVQSTEERAKDTMILILKLSVSVCVAIEDYDVNMYSYYYKHMSDSLTCKSRFLAIDQKCVGKSKSLLCLSSVQL